MNDSKCVSSYFCVNRPITRHTENQIMWWNQNDRCYIWYTFYLIKKKRERVRVKNGSVSSSILIWMELAIVHKNLTTTAIVRFLIFFLNRKNRWDNISKANKEVTRIRRSNAVSSTKTERMKIRMKDKWICSKKKEKTKSKLLCYGDYPFFVGDKRLT